MSPPGRPQAAIGPRPPPRRPRAPTGEAPSPPSNTRCWSSRQRQKNFLPSFFFVHESQGHYYSATYFRAGGRGRAGHVREKRRAITEGCPLSNLVPRDEVTILAPRETSRYEGLCFLTPGRKFSSSLLLLSLVPRPPNEISLVDHA